MKKSDLKLISVFIRTKLDLFCVTVNAALNTILPVVFSLFASSLLIVPYKAKAAVGISEQHISRWFINESVF